MPQLQASAAGLLRPHQHPDQRRFSRAILSHQRNLVAALDGEAHLPQHFLVPIALACLLHGSHRAAGLGRLRKPEVHHRLFVRNLDPFDPLQFLDPALHLLGLGRLVAKALDKRLQVLNLLPLVAIRRRQLRPSLFACLQILRIISGIDMQPLVPQLHRAIHRHIQKIPVMRDQHIAKRIAAQILLQPVARLQVQMVRRLVQQQQVGPRQQQLGQRNPHLPSAAELLRIALPILLVKAQAAQHIAHLRIQRIAIQQLHPALQQRESLGNRRILRPFVVQRCQRAGQLLQLRVHRPQRVKHGQALLKDRPPRHAQTILRQIPHR